MLRSPLFRSISAIAATLTAVAFADAQQTSAYRPQTALGALGQTGVLYPTAPAGYRVAARSGVGAQSARPLGNSAKPFNMAQGGPTISPYLNLFREEDQRAAPNYYTFVRPMQDQADATRIQQMQMQMQMQQLQRQIQQTSYSAPTGSTTGGARYGDTGHYYGGWKR